MSNPTRIPGSNAPRNHDLVEKWLRFKKTPTEQYRLNIKKFMKKFERSAVEKLFVETLLDDNR